MEPIMSRGSLILLKGKLNCSSVTLNITGIDREIVYAFRVFLGRRKKWSNSRRSKREKSPVIIVSRIFQRFSQNLKITFPSHLKWVFYDLLLYLRTPLRYKIRALKYLNLRWRSSIILMQGYIFKFSAKFCEWGSFLFSGKRVLGRSEKQHFEWWYLYHFDCVRLTLFILIYSRLD